MSSCLIFGNLRNRVWSDAYYEFIILVPENRHGHNLPDYNTDFAEKFRDVIQSNGNVLDHSELTQGLVDNNERVVKFINGHSVLTK